MQEINFKERWEGVVERFESYRGRGDVHPDFVWRVMLGLFVLGMLLVAGSGYLTYQWATEEVVLTAPARTDRVQISTKDIDDLLAVYEAKRSAFEELKHTAPIPPPVGRQTSVSHTGTSTTATSTSVR